MHRRTFCKKLLKTSLALSASALPVGISALPFLPISRPCYPRRIVKPRKLRHGNTIGLIAPGSPISYAQLQTAVANLENLGFKVVYSNSILAKNGYLAGTDVQRANDVNRMFADQSIQGIWCVRGGYGCTRILPMLDYKMIRKNPKVIIGYSDVTALLHAIFRITGLVAFHGPVAVSAFSSYTIKKFKEVLMYPMNTLVLHHAPENELSDEEAYRTYPIRSGTGEGKLVGGNLSLLASLLGTPYELDMKNKVVFIEDIGETPYRVDRMLTQLIQGRLKKASAIALGVFRNCETKTPNRSLTLKQVLLDRLFKLDIPVIYGLSFGHITHNFTIPIGINARLDVDGQTLSFLEKAVTEF